MSSANGVYFDGQTSRRQEIRAELGQDLRIVAPDGRVIAIWPLDELREVEGLASGLRLTRDGGMPLARLEIHDEALAADIRRACPAMPSEERIERSTQRRVVFWSIAAAVSFVLFGLYGVPVLADRIAPLLPWGVDQKMGRALDSQLRLILPVGDGGFACGGGTDEKPGREALDALARTLSQAAALPVPITIVAVRSDIPNALALPGGVIYLFDGLISRAKSGDEIAGVLAHEIGHVASRDGSRRALQAGGVSFLFGFVLGDFVGGTAAVAAVKALSEASYSRHAESAADTYSVGLMKRMEADPKALGELLVRLGGEEEKEHKTTPFDYLSSHPETGSRREAINAQAGAPDGPIRPIVDEKSFQAIKRVCRQKT